MANAAPYVTVLRTDLEDLRARATQAEALVKAYKELAAAKEALLDCYRSAAQGMNTGVIERIWAADMNVTELEAKS